MQNLPAVSDNKTIIHNKSNARKINYGWKPKRLINMAMKMAGQQRQPFVLNRFRHAFAFFCSLSRLIQRHTYHTRINLFDIFVSGISDFLFLQ